MISPRSPISRKVGSSFSLNCQRPGAGSLASPIPSNLPSRASPQRAVGDAARIGRFVPEVHETFAGLGDQRPIDAGEAILIDLGRELALAARSR